MNQADRKLIEDMEAGQIYHEMQPGEPPHESRYCFVCQDYKRYRKLIPYIASLRNRYGPS